MNEWIIVVLAVIVVAILFLSGTVRANAYRGYSAHFKVSTVLRNGKTVEHTIVVYSKTEFEARLLAAEIATYLEVKR